MMTINMTLMIAKVAIMILDTVSFYLKASIRCETPPRGRRLARNFSSSSRQEYLAVVLDIISQTNLLLGCFLYRKQILKVAALRNYISLNGGD